MTKRPNHELRTSRLREDIAWHNKRVEIWNEAIKRVQTKGLVDDSFLIEPLPMPKF